MGMPFILQVMMVPAYVAQKLNQLNRHRKKLIHELFFIDELRFVFFIGNEGLPVWWLFRIFTSNNQFFTATSALYTGRN
jgi:hypothetical protein